MQGDDTIRWRNHQHQLNRVCLVRWAFGEFTASIVLNGTLNDRDTFADLAGRFLSAAELANRPQEACRRFPPRVRARELWRGLDEAQDDATLLAIRDQERAGLDIITDGEQRRESYSNRFATALEGVNIDNPGTALDRSGRPNPVPRVTGRIRLKFPIELRDVEFLRANTDLESDHRAWPVHHGAAGAERFLRRRAVDGPRLCSSGETNRHPLRNKVIVLLSAKAGLRAGEIARLIWAMVTDPTGAVGTVLELPDRAAKKGSGRVIPLHEDLRTALTAWRATTRSAGPVIVSERGDQ